MEWCFSWLQLCAVNNDGQVERLGAGEDEGMQSALVKCHPVRQLHSILHVIYLLLTPCQVGGNSRAKEFFSSQPDISPGMSLRDKYNSKAAALYRDKVPLLVPLLSSFLPPFMGLMPPLLMPPLLITILITSYFTFCVHDITSCFHDITFPGWYQWLGAVTVGTQLYGLQFGQLFPWQISALSEGRSWSIETSSARHYQPPRQPSSTKNGLVLTQ